MERISPDSGQVHALHSLAATRAMEAAAASGLPSYTLMQRAGAATARLAQALAPHARHIWIACGNGNNGGDGLEAATRLHLAGRKVSVTWLGDPATAPADAHAAWQRALAAGVAFESGPPAHLGPEDLSIDALLGIGLRSQADNPRTPPDALRTLLRQLRTSPAQLLVVDLPSGLDADTGQYAAGFAPDAQEAAATAPRHTLSLLTLKPGLFTAQGRDACGSLWFDDLECGALAPAPSAQLGAGAYATRARSPHASHKGSFGDVAVIGGEGLRARGMGMTGAAWLAASAALHGGAGRVMVALLDACLSAPWPELMLRHVDALDWPRLTAVCGCGGGEAVRGVLPRTLNQAARLVLDADGLNAVASDSALAQALRRRAACGQPTILTPHPLEAARLLQCTSEQVQADRLVAAQTLAERYACSVVLKGSGTIIASPGELPHINPTGNARLATAGTGDVLAGLIGARLAQGLRPHLAASCAVQAHGAAADHWPDHLSLTASALAAALQ